MPDSSKSNNNRVASPSDGALRSYTGPGTPQDPSAWQQLIRENFWLRELIESEIKTIEARIDAGERAVALLQAFTDRTPTTMDVEHKVNALREVVFTKLEGVKTQLAERDTQIATTAKEIKENSEKAARDVKSAVDAAFVASNNVTSEQNKSNANSTAKSEASFTKQIDMLSDFNKSNAKTMDDKIADIKERITVIESRTSVSDPSTAITLAKLDEKFLRLSSSSDIGLGRAAGQTALWALIVGGLGLLFGLGTFVSLFLKVMH